MGISQGGRIAVLPGCAPAAEFSNLVHELAHELPHEAEGRTANTKTMRETEAEAVAFRGGTDNRPRLTPRCRRLRLPLARQRRPADRSHGGHLDDLRTHPGHRASQTTECDREGGLMHGVLHIVKSAGLWHPTSHSPSRTHRFREALDEKLPTAPPDQPPAEHSGLLRSG